MRQRLNETLESGRRKYRRRRRKPIPYKEKDKPTYSKLLTSWLVVMAAGWISWSYILATIALIWHENVDPLTTLSVKVCETIIGTVIVYGAKALFENISKYTVTHDTEDVDTVQNPEYYAGDYLDGSEG